MQSTPSAEEVVTVLVALWSETLETPVDRDSDFFGLGGDSLSGVAIASAVAVRYESFAGIEAHALQAIFEQPSLAAMAQELRAFMAAHPALAG
jgi:hypothetical protein